jgi:hypothetical protein
MHAPAGTLVVGNNAPMNTNVTARRIRRLDIRMAVPDIGDEEYLYPVARLLIDGEDLLADVGKWP